jgi:hypothetical protein
VGAFCALDPADCADFDDCLDDGLSPPPTPSRLDFDDCLDSPPRSLLSFPHAFVALSLSLSVSLSNEEAKVVPGRPVFSVGAREELKTRGGSLSSEGTNAAVKAERSAPIKVLRSLAYINIPIVNDIATYNCIIGVHLHGQSCTHIVQGRRYSETQIGDEVEVVHEDRRKEWLEMFLLPKGILWHEPHAGKQLFIDPYPMYPSAFNCYLFYILQPCSNSPLSLSLSLRWCSTLQP